MPQADLHAWVEHPEITLAFEAVSHHYRFARLTAEDAERLMTGHPNIDPNDCQNDSPTQRELVSMAHTVGGTLEGYVIKTTSGRKDARIQCDAATLQLDEDQARQLQARWAADEFDRVDECRYRFWWD